MENSKQENGEGRKGDYRPVVGIAIVSLLVCGLFFPLLITGIAQVILPYQANGQIDHLNGQPIGSNVITQNFTQPFFFHPRNDSASGLDPDITVQDAISQIPRISNATGIPVAALQQLVDENTDRQGQAVELQYINVLSVNLLLVQTFPSAYSSFT